jgi:hypothetical protein
MRSLIYNGPLCFVSQLTIHYISINDIFVYQNADPVVPIWLMTITSQHVPLHQVQIRLYHIWIIYFTDGQIPLKPNSSYRRSTPAHQNNNHRWVYMYFDKAMHAHDTKNTSSHKWRISTYGHYFFKLAQDGNNIVARTLDIVKWFPSGTLITWSANRETRLVCQTKQSRF